MAVDERSGVVSAVFAALSRAWRCPARPGAAIGAMAFGIVVACAVSAGPGAGTAGAFEHYKEYKQVPFYAAPSVTQAGGHPDLYVEFTVENHDQEEAEGVPPSACHCEDARDASTRFPAGIIGNPNNVPRCTQVDFNNHENCSSGTQVGIAHPGIFGNPYSYFESKTPLYNLEPHPGQAGLLGFYLPLAETPAYIILSARTGDDYGLTSTVKGIEHLIPADGFILELWGVPAESRHDSDRCTAIAPVFGECTSTGPSNAELKPFLSNPTTCEGGLTSSLHVVYYSGKITDEESSWPTSTGCDQLTYNPSLFAQPTTTETDSPTGLDVDLRVPQLQSPTAPSPSETRASTVTLPPGMAINPNAADGKTSCSESQARFGSEEEANCPELAKVGTLSLTSTALPGPIPGFIYLGEPEPGNRYRIFLTANGFATHVKLAGSIEPDPKTGQLVASFRNLPQAPFSDLNLHFFGSERGLLTTPSKCGTYPVTSTFTPWDSALSAQTSTQYFTLDSGPNGTPCPGSTRPFNPGFEGAVTDATAGVRSPFFINLTRADGDQSLTAVNVTTPPGLLASLAGIPYCPDAALGLAADSSYSGLEEERSPSCPPASQIGVSDTGVGAGTHPVHLPGKVYLAGPYKGAPISLAVITPAVSGPYDLGNVLVRAALQVNPETVQVTAVSDPLPQILEGIPLRLRSILVNLNRPGFTLNPTNCDPFSVEGRIFGDQGTEASASSHFQVANCAGLPFSPKLSMKLTGGVKRRGHPAIHAVLSASPGEANLHRVSVTLPQGELLDNAHIGAVCTRPDFANNACPPSSLIGQAEVNTPLLDQPLKGSVYLRSSKHELPDLALDLSGQVDIEAVGHVDSANGRLRVRFESIPDVPVSRIVLDLAGGSKGLLANSETLCQKPKQATVKMVGQNGAHLDRKATLQVSCQGTRPKRPPHRARKVG